MSPTFDAIVIGAGHNGLTCACYLARIATIDAAGPTLRSVIELNPDALTIAAERDQERQAKGARGPLHGVPMLVKDSIDTDDRMMTTAGSLALEGNMAPRDAIIAPTEGSPPFVIDPIVGDNLLQGGCSTPPAVAGYPHISVPAGYVHGLPVGLSLFAGAYAEGKLISYAYAFEQATKVRHPPEFRPTIGAS